MTGFNVCVTNVFTTRQLIIKTILAIVGKLRQNPHICSGQNKLLVCLFDKHTLKVPKVRICSVFVTLKDTIYERPFDSGCDFHGPGKEAHVMCGLCPFLPRLRVFVDTF